MPARTEDNTIFFHMTQTAESNNDCRTFTYFAWCRIPSDRAISANERRLIFALSSPRLFRCVASEIPRPS